MAHQKASDKSRRLVWRISDRAPLGEWVDPKIANEVSKKDKDLPEVSSGRWVRSSFDLLNGVDIDESPNTVPDELFDELFSQHKDPKSPGH